MRFWFGSPFYSDWRDPSQGDPGVWSQPVAWTRDHGASEYLATGSVGSSSPLRLGPLFSKLFAPETGAAQMGWKEGLANLPDQGAASLTGAVESRIADGVAEALSRVYGLRNPGLDLPSLFGSDQDLDLDFSSFLADQIPLEGGGLGEAHAINPAEGHLAAVGDGDLMAADILDAAVVFEGPLEGPLVVLEPDLFTLAPSIEWGG